MQFMQSIRKDWRRWVKRFPILLFALAWGLTLCLSQPSAAVLSRSHQEIRGVWITTNDTDVLIDRPKLENAIGQLARLNLNTIYPVVWNAGYALYPSIVAQRAGIQHFVRQGNQGYDILAEVITQAHQRGMLAVPWFEFGFMAPGEYALHGAERGERRGIAAAPAEGRVAHDPLGLLELLAGELPLPGPSVGR